jgi:hypothetical protein
MTTITLLPHQIAERPVDQVVSIELPRVLWPDGDVTIERVRPKGDGVELHVKDDKSDADVRRLLVYGGIPGARYALRVGDVVAYVKVGISTGEVAQFGPQGDRGRWWNQNGKR